MGVQGGDPGRIQSGRLVHRPAISELRHRWQGRFKGRNRGAGRGMEGRTPPPQVYKYRGRRQDLEAQNPFASGVGQGAGVAQSLGSQAQNKRSPFERHPVSARSVCCRRTALYPRDRARDHGMPPPSVPDGDREGEVSGDISGLSSERLTDSVAS